MRVKPLTGKAAAVVSPTRKPYLYRHPEVGILIVILCMALFAILATNVINNETLIQTDERIAQALHQQARHGPWVILLVLYGFSAAGREGVVFFLLALSIIWIRQKRWRELTMLIYGVAGAEALFQALSGNINRHRPVFPDPIETINGPGFPSGHVTTSIILYGLILYLLWPKLSPKWRKIGPFLVLLFVGLIGLARMYIGTHYMTDILGGLLAGLAWGTAVVTGVEAAYWRHHPGDT